MKIIVLFYFNLLFLPINFAVANENSFHYFVFCFFKINCFLFFFKSVDKNIISKMNLGRPLVSKLYYFPIF